MVLDGGLLAEGLFQVVEERGWDKASSCITVDCML